MTWLRKDWRRATPTPVIPSRAAGVAVMDQELDTAGNSPHRASAQNLTGRCARNAKSVIAAAWRLRGPNLGADLSSPAVLGTVALSGRISLAGRSGRFWKMAALITGVLLNRIARMEDTDGSI